MYRGTKYRYWYFLLVGWVGVELCRLMTSLWVGEGVTRRAIQFYLMDVALNHRYIPCIGTLKKMQTTRKKVITRVLGLTYAPYTDTNTNTPDPLRVGAETRVHTYLYVGIICLSRASG